MKQSLLICAAAALLAGSSCSEQEPFDAAMPVRLSVAGISPGSRAAANYAADDYFGQYTLTEARALPSTGK